MIFEPFTPFLASAYQIKFATEALGDARRRGAAPPGVLRRAGPVRRRRPRRDRRGRDPDRRDLAVRRRRRRGGRHGAHPRDAETRRLVGLAARGGQAIPPRSARSAPALIRLAVSSAHARGCHTFLAPRAEPERAAVPAACTGARSRNVELHGRPHHMMQADLDFYPPFADARRSASSRCRRRPA